MTFELSIQCIAVNMGLFSCLTRHVKNFIPTGCKSKHLSVTQGGEYLSVNM